MDNTISPIPPKSKLIELKKIKRQISQINNVKIDLTKTEYQIIKIVANKLLKWKLWTRQDQKHDSNIFWIDTYVTQDCVRKLKHYQKINHFPNSQEFGKKNKLAQNLKYFKQKFPDLYDFFPQTWLLPKQAQQFRENINKKQNQSYYIAKPQAGSQGKGIFLFNKLQNINLNYPHVVQEYIINPFLIQNLKFDFRIYVLLKSLNPLKIFVYKQGLARLATHNYQIPTNQNLNDLTMHLTNYAINKRNPQFIFNNSFKNDSTGHKRSYSSVLEILRTMGKDTKNLQIQVNRIIIKSILSGYDKMLESYKSARPPDQVGSVCFQVLGFDILIDQNFKPILIQINHTPSFTTDTPLDTIIKKYMILDTLNLLNIPFKQKEEYIKSKKDFQTENMNEKEKKKFYLQQNQYENNHLGGYIKIYPCDNVQDMKTYEKILNIKNTNKKTNYLYKPQYIRNNSITKSNVDKQQYSINDLSTIQKCYNEYMKKKNSLCNSHNFRITNKMNIRIGKLDQQENQQKNDNIFVNNNNQLKENQSLFNQNPRQITFISNQQLNSKIKQNSHLLSTENQKSYIQKTFHQKIMESLKITEQESNILRKAQKQRLLDFEKRGLVVNMQIISLRLSNSNQKQDAQKKKLKSSFYQNGNKFHHGRVNYNPKSKLLQYSLMSNIKKQNNNSVYKAKPE